MPIDLTSRSRTLLLLGRDLRLSVHALGPILLRSGLAVVMIAALVMGKSWSSIFGAPGLTLLQWATELDYWVLVLCGIGLFPSLLLSEREQGSHDLLRLSGCGPAALLLGRSLAVLALMCLAGLVQLPFLLLATALGGVDLARVLGCVALLGCHALLVYGAALLASARAPTTLAAIRRATVLVALVSFAPAWLATVLRWLAPGPTGPFSMLIDLLRELSGRLPHGLLPAWCTGTALSGPVLRNLLFAGAALLVASLWLFRDAPAAVTTRERPTRPRPRAPQRAPLRAWAKRELGGGLCGRFLLALAIGSAIWLGVRRPGALLGSFDLVGLMLCQAAVMILHAAWLGAQSMRTYAAEPTLPLLALVDARPAWLTQLRQVRWMWLTLHSVFLAATVVPMRGRQDDFAPFVLASLGVALAADAVGERCGLALRAAPLAVSLLAAFGLGAIAFVGCVIIAPRDPGGVFIGCGVVFGALAADLYRRNRAGWRWHAAR